MQHKRCYTVRIEAPPEMNEQEVMRTIKAALSPFRELKLVTAKDVAPPKPKQVHVRSE